MCPKCSPKNTSCLVTGKQLSPSDKCLYKTASKAMRDTRRYKKRVKEVLAREKKLKQGISNLDWLESKVNRSTADFIRLQIREQRHKPRGRRYTLQDKLFSLILMKNSPQQYRKMRRIFALPSKDTIMRVRITENHCKLKWETRVFFLFFFEWDERVQACGVTKKEDVTFLFFHKIGKENGKLVKKKWKTKQERKKF